MSSSKTTLAILVTIVGAVITAGAVTGVLLHSVTLPSEGTVKAIGVGVYWDSSCSDPVSLIDWDTIEPGATESVNVYVRNEGNASVTLSLDTESWNPSTASSYMSLDWDYAGQVIDVDGVVGLTLSLSVSDTIEGITSFSFDIIIMASG